MLFTYLVYFILHCLVLSAAQNTDEPPSFVKSSPKLIYFKFNDTVSLDCKAVGNPSIKYTWRKNGVNLGLSAPNILRKDDGTIRLSPATDLDEGFYQCIAENKYGVTISNVTQLQRAVIQAIGLKHLTNDLEVIEGQPFVIPASTFKVIPRSSGQYVWMKYAGDLNVSPQRIVPDERIQIADNGDLHFAYVNSSDDLGGKLYLDVVSNPFLNITIEGNYTKLNVKSNGSDIQQFPPSLAFSSVSRSPGLEGEDVTMRCFFSGNNEPTITWLVQRGNLPLGRFITSDANTKLTIINMTESDEMSYYCRAENSQGSDEHEIPFEASPRFLRLEDSPQQARVLEKESAEFRCNASAKPEADIVWFFNGKSLNDNPRKRFAISADRKTLTISLVCRECKDPDGVDLSDSGVIQCNASNVHGYALGTGYLDVISIKEGKVEISGSQENSVPFEFAFFAILTLMVLISF